MGLSLWSYANNLYWNEPTVNTSSLTFEIDFPAGQTWTGLAEIALDAKGDAGEGFAAAYIVSYTNDQTTNSFWNHWYLAPSVVSANFYSIIFAVTAQFAFASARVTLLQIT